jgi:dTDP-4-amino-4,6-dideoxygalactose transaminase
MAVFIGSIPNTQSDDISLTRRILKGNKDLSNSIKNIHQLLRDSLQLKDKINPFLFNRGRDSLSFFLRLLNLKEDDEVVVQAFTCVAVVAPILWNKAKPIYVDIKPNSFNMDLDLLQTKISKRTRVVIIQHTFGNIADIKKVREIIDRINLTRKDKEKIYLIEDCAHLFPSSTKKRESGKGGSKIKSNSLNSFHDIGRHSDMYFFSFSQDKSISCTQGAAMIVNNEKLLTLAKEEFKNIKELSQREALYNARYIRLWNIIKKTYFKKIIPFTRVTIGRILIVLFRTLGLIKKQASADITQFEGIKKMSAIQATLLANQLKKIEGMNNHREKITNIYNKNLRKEMGYETNNKTLLRYPLLISNKEEIKERLLEKKIIVGNWYRTPVYPLDSKLEQVKYVKGSCPIAEINCKNILNLPTNMEVSEQEAVEICKILNAFAKPVNI